MQRKFGAGIVLATVAASPFFVCGAEPGALEAIERIRADIKRLSSDAMEGRGPGTRGEELATAYIAGEFAKAGLEPAGPGGAWFQFVPLIGITTDSNARLAALKDGRVIDFRWGEEFVGQTRSQRPNDEFDSEAVFVGHGIIAPEFDWNDYRDVDVKGRVVVLFTNEPPSHDASYFGGRSLTYYGRWTYKLEEATRQGARAAFIIHTNETAGYPFSVPRRSETTEGSQIKKPGNEPSLALAGWLSRQAGQRLLELANTSVDAALLEADTKGFRARPLGLRLKGRIATRLRPFVSKNVVGRIPGSDPALQHEAVLYTAHWDHLGLGNESAGDNIHNGAADNGTGCGILLELARTWADRRPRPKRSGLFLATTAEEQGLLGAQFYADHPAVPLGKTAVNLNFDTVHPLGVPESIVANGAERTTAWPLIRDVARRMRIELEPDKRAHLGLFYRSDHFALARGGVPAFSIRPGDRIRGKPEGAASRAVEQYFANIYHTPADEYRDDWDFSGYPLVIEFAISLGQHLANAEQLPTWNPGDEFRPAREKSLRTR